MGDFAGGAMSARRVEDRIFGSVTTRLVHDSIANRTADVLVNAANDQLQMGGGVAAALRSRGGIEIHQEAIRHAPARIGSVVRTGAGALDARWVYHAVVIDYELRKGTTALDVAEVVANVVTMAVGDGARSVALPLFGAGVGGLSVEASLTAILEALEAAAPSVPGPCPSRSPSETPTSSTRPRRCLGASRRWKRGRPRRTGWPRRQCGSSSGTTRREGENRPKGCIGSIRIVSSRAGIQRVAGCGTPRSSASVPARRGRAQPSFEGRHAASAKAIAASSRRPSRRRIAPRLLRILG